MIPRKLSLRNFMCYREDVPTLDFDGIGIACLSGENGAGKSALLDALTWALWGEARLKSDDDLIALGATEMEVDLVFALDGQDYRVIRKRNKGKRTGQSWLDFQVRNDGNWKQLTGATLRETQQSITSTLHMGYDTFANSAFLRQGRADEFTRKEPAKRKQVLAEILGLDIYEQLETKAKERAKTLDGQIKVVEGQIAELERQAEGREYHASEVARADARVGEQSSQVEQTQHQFEQASRRVQELEQLKPRREELDQRLRQLSRERDDLVIAVEKLRRAVNEGAAIIAQRAEIRAGVATLHAAQAEAERLDGRRAAYETLLDQQRGHEDDFKEAERQLQTKLQVAEAGLNNFQERAARRPQFETEMSRLKAQIGDFKKLQEELGKLRLRRADLREQMQQASDMQLKRKDIEHQIDLRKDSLVGTREEIKRRLKDHAEKLKPAERWQADLERAQQRQFELEQAVAQLANVRGEEHTAVERAGELRAACENIKQQGEDINRKLALLGEDTHACPLCGNELGHDGASHIEAEYERERQELRAKFSSSNAEVKAIEASLTKLRTEIKGHEASANELPKLAAQLARLEADLAAAAETRIKQAEDQRTYDAVQMQLVKGDYEHGVRAELSRIEATLSALGDLNAISRQMDQIEHQIGRIEKQIEEQNDARGKIESLAHNIKQIDDELPALHEQEATLHELQTTLAIGDFAREPRAALERVKRELAALGYTPEVHRAANEQARSLLHWDEQARKLQNAEDRLADNQAALERDEQALRRRDDERDAMLIQVSSLQEQLQALGPASRERDDAKAMLEKSAPGALLGGT